MSGVVYKVAWKNNGNCYDKVYNTDSGARSAIKWLKDHGIPMADIDISAVVEAPKPVDKTTE